MVFAIYQTMGWIRLRYNTTTTVGYPYFGPATTCVRRGVPCTTVLSVRNSVSTMISCELVRFRVYILAVERIFAALFCEFRAETLHVMKPGLGIIS